MMDLDWPSDAFMRPHTGAATNGGRPAPGPTRPFQFTGDQSNLDDIMPFSLYTTSDPEGNPVPSPAYSDWLSSLPEPMNPMQRHARELQSYPTGVMRSAKRRRDEGTDGDGANMPAGRAGTPWPQPHDHREPLGPFPVNATNKLKLPAARSPSGPPIFTRRTCNVLDMASTLTDQPQDEEPKTSYEKAHPNKLQKKNPHQTPFEDQNQHHQEPPRKLARFEALSRAFSSRRGRNTSNTETRDDTPSTDRPSTSLGAAFFSPRRLSTVLQTSRKGSNDMNPRRWSLSFRSHGEPERTGNPADAGGCNTPTLSSRLSAMFSLVGEAEDLGDHPRVLDLEDSHSGDYRMQIAFVGDATVGKSSLIKHFANGHYDKDYNPTNKDLHLMLMPCEGGVSCRVELHDCGGGQEESDISHLSQSWWDAVVVCYSVGDAASLSSCTSRWIADARKNAEGVPVYLIGLKTDRRTPRVELNFIQPETQIVSRLQGEEAAQSIGAERYLECSATTGEGVADVFRTIVSHSLPRIIENAKRASDRHHLHKPRSDVLYGTTRKLKSLLRNSRDGKLDAITVGDCANGTETANGHRISNSNGGAHGR